MRRMNWRGPPKSPGSHEEEVAERKEQQWRRGTERPSRALQEACPGNGQEEVNVGSWRCVGRKHQAVHPSRATTSNAERQQGNLMRLRKSGQRRRKFPRTFEAQTHLGERCKEREGAEPCEAPGAASPGGVPEEPGEEGLSRSLAGNPHRALPGERTAGWQRGRAEKGREASTRRSGREVRG